MKEKKVNIAIVGALGRMGINNLRIIDEQQKMKIVAAVDSDSCQKIGQRVTSVIANFSDYELVFNSDAKGEIVSKQAEVCVDFSTPDATCQILKDLKEIGYKGCYIIGTTGFDESQEKLIQEISNSFLIIKSGNFNIGVNVLLNLVEKTTHILKKYDIEIVEHHHNQKVDSPSGTAKMLLNACNPQDKKVVNGRDGIIGKREKNEIGMSVVRGGGIIGKHEVHFISNNDQLSLVHNAFHRDAFTSGVINCIEYYLENTEKIGLLSMKNILGLEKN